jgi:glycopeptide antibiotics resistance protein
LPSINHIRPFNLIPFKTITQNFTDGGTPLQHRAYELIGNTLVLTPIGVFLAFVMRKFSIWPVIFAGVSISTAVEITQYLRWTWRVADVDDVICNSVGALVSYVIVAYVLNHYNPKQFPSLRSAE